MASEFYDAAVGRFWTIDPLAEADAHQTPYAYANNNPVSNIDVDGLASDKPVDGGNPISGRQIEVHATRIQKSDQGSKSLSGSEMNFLDKLQVGLSVAQFIPGLNTVVGLANAAIDVYKGDYGSALLNVLGAIPVAGVAIKGIAVTTKIITVVYKAKIIKTAILSAGTIIKVEKAVAHGNSLSSPAKTYFYKLFKNDGTFLKNGITSKLDPIKRYSKKFMEDKYMETEEFATRQAAYLKEYGENLINKGPLNKNMH